MADQGPFAMPQHEPSNSGESQGGGGNELHQQFISSAPEELRGAAEQLVPLWDKHVQGKFQEAANYRKQWEAYEPLGLNNFQPQDVQQALSLHQAIQDPEQLPELYSQLGQYMEANGLMPQGTDIQPGAGAEEYGAEDDYGTDPRLLQTVTQMQQQMQQMGSYFQQMQEQQAHAQAEAYVNSQLDQLKQANPNLGDEDMDTICTFALKYEGNDAIQRGFADYQALMSRAEQGVFQKKSEAPAPANSGGSAATKPEPITSFADAAKAARERFAQGA